MRSTAFFKQNSKNLAETFNRALELRNPSSLITYKMLIYSTQKFIYTYFIKYYIVMYNNLFVRIMRV